MPSLGAAGKIVSRALQSRGAKVAPLSVVAGLRYKDWPDVMQVNTSRSGAAGTSPQALLKPSGYM